MVDRTARCHPLVGGTRQGSLRGGRTAGSIGKVGKKRGGPRGGVKRGQRAPLRDFPRTRDFSSKTFAGGGRGWPGAEGRGTTKGWASRGGAAKPQFPRSGRLRTIFPWGNRANGEGDGAFPWCSNRPPGGKNFSPAGNTGGGFRWVAGKKIPWGRAGFRAKVLIRSSGAGRGPVGAAPGFVDGMFGKTSEKERVAHKPCPGGGRGDRAAPLWLGRPAQRGGGAAACRGLSGQPPFPGAKKGGGRQGVGGGRVCPPGRELRSTRHYRVGGPGGGEGRGGRGRAFQRTHRGGHGSKQSGT